MNIPVSKEYLTVILEFNTSLNAIDKINNNPDSYTLFPILDVLS